MRNVLFDLCVLSVIAGIVVGVMLMTFVCWLS